MNKLPLHIALINALDALLTIQQETQAKLTAETRAKGITPGRTRAEMLAQQRTNFECYQQSGSMGNNHRMQMHLQPLMPHIPITMFSSIRGHVSEIDSTNFNEPVNSIFDPAVFNAGNYAQMTKSTPDATACPGCKNCRPSAQPARTLGEVELTGFNRYAEEILDSPLSDADREYFKDWTAPVLPDPETIQWKDLAAKFAAQAGTVEMPESYTAHAQTLHDVLQIGLGERRAFKCHMTLTELLQRINAATEAMALKDEVDLTDPRVRLAEPVTVKLDEEDVDPTATVATFMQAYVNNQQPLTDVAFAMLAQLEKMFGPDSNTKAIVTKYFQDIRDHSTNPLINSLPVSALMDIQNHDDVMKLILQLFPDMSRIDGRDDAYWISHDGERHILPVIGDVIDTALEITDACRLSAIVYVDYEMTPRSNLYRSVKQAHEKLLALPRPDVGPDHYVVYICH